MTIQHSIPSDKRRPGVYTEFDDTSGARGLVPTTRRILLIGMKTASGSAAADTPVQCFTEAEAETKFGQGSEVALMVRKVLETWQKLLAKGGAAAELWVAPIVEPGGGTAGTFTLTVTGSATEAGDIHVQVNGVDIRAGIANGDAQNTSAGKLNTAVQKFYSKIPVTSGVATNVVTLTLRHKGVIAQDLDVRVISAPAGVTVVAAAAVAGAGAAAIATALGNCLDRDYTDVAIGNHAAQDITDLKTHMDSAWGSSVKKYRWAYVGETGTVSTATTLATAANYKQIDVVSYEDAKELCGQIAASVAAMRASREKPNYNFNGTVLPLVPPPAASVYTDAEVETLLAGGCTPITVNEQNESKLERLVTTKTTVSSVPFENLLDLAHSRTVAFTAKQVEAKFAVMLEGANLDDEFIEDLRQAAVDILEKEEDLGYLQNVDDHLGDLRVERDPVVPGRVVVDIPESVVPAANQVITKHRLFVE